MTRHAFGMSNATIEFPSDKACEKLPRIVVDGNANAMIEWINQHNEIDRRVPPVLSGWFVIEIQQGKYKIIICATYTKDKTAFVFRASINGLRAVIASMDYAKIDNDGIATVDFHCSAGALRTYSEDWLRQFAIFSVNFIIAVQAYILYHKPEVIEQVVDASAPRKTPENSHQKKRKKNGSVKIKSTVRKLIRIDTRELPPREYKYKKLAWSVRGHYRHVGKEKKLKYIAPFTCNRGGAKGKPKAKTYVVVGNKKQEP